MIRSVDRPERLLLLCVPDIPRRPNNAQDLYTLGALYLKAAAEAVGWRCAVIDAYQAQLPAATCAERIAAARPDAVGFTVTNPSMLDQALAIMAAADAAMGIQVPMVVGGHHVSLCGERVMAAAPRIDAAVQGEGEAPLKALLWQLDGGGEPRPIDGVIARGPAGLVRGAPRAAEAELDALDPPDLAYPAPQLGPDSWSLVTSRGCSAGCTYCSIGPAWGRIGHWRGHSAVWVADALRRLRALGATSVNVVDDQFVGTPASVARARELVALLRGDAAHLPLTIMARADTVVAHPDLIAELREVGLVQIFLGLESGSDRSLRAWGKGTDVATGEAAVAILDRLGIRAASGTILFHPEMDLASLERDVAWFTELGERYGQFYLYGLNELDVLHGTPLARRLADGSEAWRQVWTAADADAGWVYECWVEAQLGALFPACLILGEDRSFPVRRALARWQLDTLGRLIALARAGERARWRLVDAVDDMATLVHRLGGAAAVLRYWQADHEPDLEQERCFDVVPTT